MPVPVVEIENSFIPTGGDQVWFIDWVRAFRQATSSVQSQWCFSFVNCWFYWEGATLVVCFALPSVSCHKTNGCFTPSPSTKTSHWFYFLGCWWSYCFPKKYGECYWLWNQHHPAETKPMVSFLCYSSRQAAMACFLVVSTMPVVTSREPVVLCIDKC